MTCRNLLAQVYCKHFYETEVTCHKVLCGRQVADSDAGLIIRENELKKASVLQTCQKIQETNNVGEEARDTYSTRN